MSFQLRVLVCLVISAVLIIPVIAAEQIVSGNVTAKDETSLVTSVIDRTITYQGMLKNNSGIPIPNSTYNLTFRIYNQSSGGSALWTSIAIPVMTSSGLFSTLLGPISLPFDTTYYISIQVAGDAEMTRQTMTMSPYSASADTANFAKAVISDAKWAFRITDTADTMLISGGRWGLARSGNILWGNADSTHVNLGVQCTTGTSGQNYKYCTVGGGRDNAASGWYATVNGGWNNTASYSYATVGGGYHHTASNLFATVSGGQSNTASNNHSTVSGGAGNTASGYGATVGGGGSNISSGNYATVGGGSNNYASGVVATVDGGELNAASGDAATIGGGSGNRCGGDYSCIPGGLNDSIDASGDYSLVFGNGVYCNDDYRVSFFDGANNGCLNINRDGRDGYLGYPLQIGTGFGNGGGAYLSGTGVWTNSSSRTFKENFTPFDGAELLRKISALSVTTYNYKNSTEKHIGPVAEEFVGAFDTGVIRESDGKREDMYLAASDVAGVALAGVQELLKMNNEMKELIAKLQTKNIELERRMAELERK